MPASVSTRSAPGATTAAKSSSPSAGDPPCASSPRTSYSSSPTATASTSSNFVLYLPQRTLFTAAHLISQPYLQNFVPLQYEKLLFYSFIILIIYSYNYERKQKVQHLEDHHPVHHHRTHRRRKLLPHPELPLTLFK